MHPTNTLYVCATLIASTVAQTASTTSLHFTTIPTALVAGVKQTIGWAGGNGNGVNIILQQGPADNLKDVPIAPIATGDEGTSTTWTPPKSLPDAGNYALRIEQGEDSINYSGMLQLFDGCSTCPTDAVAALVSSTASTTASSPSSTASSSSKSGSGTPVVAPVSKPSSNSTAAAGSSGNSTTTSSSMNSTMGTGSMANMTMPGTNSTTNSTLSSATPHATSSKSSSSHKPTSSSTSSSSSESTSSSTGSSTSPSATKKSSGVTAAASNFALVLCAIVGVVYLG